MYEDLLTAAEVADVMKVSSQTVKRWFHQGKISAIPLPSGQLRFPRSDIEDLLKPQRLSASPSASSASEYEDMF